MKKKRCATGGPIEPNYQTLGNIKFDSNKAKNFNGVLSVKDENSGKDFGVVRNVDGSYRWFNPDKEKIPSQVDYSKNFYKDFIESKQYYKINKVTPESQLEANLIKGDPKFKNKPSDLQEMYRQGMDWDKAREFEDWKKSELDVISKADVRIQKSPEGGSYSRNSDGVIFVDPTAKHERKFDRQDIITHELSHNKSRDSKSKSNAAGNRSYTHFRGPYDPGEMFRDYMETSRIESYHDNPEEYKADVNALRFRLMRENIYDPMNQDFTPEHLNKIKQNPKLSKDPVIERFLRLSKDDEAAIKAMNSITEVDMKKRKNIQYAVTGGDIGSGLQKAAPGLMAIPGYGWIAGAAAYGAGALLKSMDPKDKPMYGSPGSTQYNYGGPVTPMPQDSLPRYMPTVTPDSGIISTATPRFTPEYMSMLPTTPTKTTGPIIDDASYNKVNRRYLSGQGRRDLENRTQVTADFNAVGNNKHLSADRYRYASGGDIQLSSDSFQVKGNPQVTDGNTYPELNAKLDHNEVVSTTQDGTKFVFSDTLKLGKKSFAQIVKPIERAKGKAEKLLASTPGDRISKNTVALSNKLLDDVAMQQEQLAAAKGHRNSDGSTKQPGQYATGGMLGPGDPVYPESGKPFMAIGPNSNFYYDPWNDRYYERQTDGQYFETSVAALPFDAPILSKQDINNHIQYHTPGTTSSQPVSTSQAQPGNQTTQATTKTPGKPSPKKTKYSYDVTKQGPLTISNNIQGMSVQSPSNPNKFMDIKGKDVFGQPNPTTETKNIPSENYKKSLSTLPLTNLNLETRVPGGIDPITGIQQPDLIEATPGFSMKSRMSAPQTALDGLKTTAADANPLLGGTTTDRYQTPWTTGDYLKVIELAGKGIDAFGKAEQEQVYPDRTSISKASFDARPQLYQSQRNLSNYMSGVDTGNINLRRGLFGQAYAQKLNTDSQIVNQYQQMNNQAQVQYEDRLSNQRRFNVGQQTYTDNINAANRAAQDMVTQNALTSVGQFGEDLNRKQYSTDLVNLLQMQYPDVYKNVYNQLNAKKVINGGQ